MLYLRGDTSCLIPTWQFDDERSSWTIPSLSSYCRFATLDGIVCRPFRLSSLSCKRYTASLVYSFLLDQTPSGPRGTSLIIICAYCINVSWDFVQPFTDTYVGYRDSRRSILDLQYNLSTWWAVLNDRTHILLDTPNSSIDALSWVFRIGSEGSAPQSMNALHMSVYISPCWDMSEGSIFGVLILTDRCSDVQQS